MKYLFGDSAEFPLQRDFLALLDNFLDTGSRTVALENAVLGLKENIEERQRRKASVLEEMDRFLSAVEAAISGAASGSKERDAIAEYAERSKDFMKKLIDEAKAKFSDDISKEIAQLEEKVNQADEENRKTLESFFIKDPVPIKNKKYTFKTAKDGNSASVQLDCEGDISCVFSLAYSEVPFWDYRVKSFDFLEGVKVPARMKKPFLKKEAVPDIVMLDDYYLSELVLTNDDLEAVFRRRLEPEAERFRLKIKFMDGTVELYHAEENGVETSIMAIPELERALNPSKLHELGDKIAEQTHTLYPKRQKLDVLYLSGKDAVKENLIFELMQKVAGIFNPTVAEIKRHGSSEGELSLKTEDETGRRSEIYLKRSQVNEKLGAIGDKGGRLVEILDVK